MDARQWYAALVKPSWTPPGWISDRCGVCVCDDGRGGLADMAKYGFKEAGLALVFFSFNFSERLWTWIFFGLQRPGLATIEILILWVAIVATMILFWRKNPAAGRLLVPYAAGWDSHQY